MLGGLPFPQPPPDALSACACGAGVLRDARARFDKRAREPPPRLGAPLAKKEGGHFSLVPAIRGISLIDACREGHRLVWGQSLPVPHTATSMPATPADRLSFEQVAFGIMAPAIPLRVGISAQSACNSQPSDLVACMVHKWLPADVDTVLLHDCFSLCLRNAHPMRVGPNRTCQPRKPVNVPVPFVNTNSRLHRLCFYGPLHGSHALSYSSRHILSGFHNVSLNRSRPAREVPLNRSHNWAKRSGV